MTKSEIKKAFKNYKRFTLYTKESTFSTNDYIFEIRGRFVIIDDTSDSNSLMLNDYEVISIKELKDKNNA